MTHHGLQTNGEAHTFHFSCIQAFRSIDSLSKYGGFEYHGEVDFCEQDPVQEDHRFKIREWIVIRLLTRHISLSPVTEPGEKRHKSAVVDHTLGVNTTRCRFAIRGPTVTDVKILNGPSKDGRLRPLRPPCLL